MTTKKIILVEFILLASLLLVELSESANSISIKCNSSVPLGELRNVESYKKNLPSLVNQLFKIDASFNHYSKLENNLERVVSIEMHPFIGAVHLAFVNHLKLTITPDMIWHLIASGTANYINQNAERLRSKFVLHDGKRKITVRRDDFIFNSSLNKWSEVIDEFSHRLGEFTLGNVSQLFKANFSTTNSVSSVVSEIVLMDAMQKYFQFEFVSLCTIPEIKLMGSRDDWENIRSRVRHLNQTIPDLAVWYSKIDPLLAQFVDASQGVFDYEFWNQIYKVHGGSGGPYLSGWVITFFPFIENNSKNYYVWEKSWRDAYDEQIFGGLVTSNFPVTLNKVDFKWKFLGAEFDMLFVGGLIGIDFNDQEKMLTPIFGYSICQNSQTKSS